MVDRLHFKKSGSPNNTTEARLIEIAFDRAMALESEVSEDVLQISGMSGRLYRMFINNLVRITSKPRYLEVGSWAGSTCCAAMDKNVVKVVCIDNWSQFGGPKDQFFENTGRIRNDNIDFSFIESDFRSVDVSTLGLFNIYLFDGPHDERDQYDGLALFDMALEDDLIFIVDDWNWLQVRDGTLKAIRDTGFSIDYSIEVRTTLDNEHGLVHGAAGDWHNGYFISKLSRVKRRYHLG